MVGQRQARPSWAWEPSRYMRPDSLDLDSMAAQEVRSFEVSRAHSNWLQRGREFHKWLMRDCHQINPFSHRSLTFYTEKRRQRTQSRYTRDHVLKAQLDSKTFNELMDQDNAIIDESEGIESVQEAALQRVEDMTLKEVCPRDSPSTNLAT